MRVESRILVINRSRLVINSTHIGDRIARGHDYENIHSFYKHMYVITYMYVMLQTDVCHNAFTSNRNESDM